MAVSKDIVIILILSVASSSAILKSQYGWDEYIQLCSSSLSDMVRAICPSDYNVEPTENSRFKRSQVTGISTYCCKAICTPIFILNNYCQHPHWVDTSRDLVIFQNKPPIPPSTDQTTTSHLSTSTKPITVGARVRRSDHKHLTMVMYCYMGIKQYCNDGM